MMKPVFSKLLEQTLYAIGAVRFKNIETTKMKTLERLEWIDLSCLWINGIVEYTFILHITHFFFTSPEVPRSPMELTFSNTVIGSFVAFFGFDLIYWGAHNLAHHRALYPYVHKHH